MEVPKTKSSRLFQRCDDLEQYGRMLCVKILDIDGDDFVTSYGVLDKCKELFNNLELDILEAYIDWVHRIGK